MDDTLKAEFRLSFDRGFRELVVYTPPRDDDFVRRVRFRRAPGERDDRRSAAAKADGSALRWRLLPVLRSGGPATLFFSHERQR